jgi:hypothetical protein
MSAEIDREVEDRIKARIEAEQRQGRDEFDRLFAVWLTNRAAYQNPDAEWTSETEAAHTTRGHELARLITTFPGIYSWMIFSKLEVLEHYLASDGGTTWNDNREIVMLAGIKADLLKFVSEVEEA